MERTSNIVPLITLQLWKKLKAGFNNEALKFFIENCPKPYCDWAAAELVIRERGLS